MSESVSEIFKYWKAEEITKAVFQELTRRKEVLLEELEMSAGNDSNRDRFVVGYITAVNDFIKMEVQEVIEESQDD